MEDVAIIGSGMAGSAAALALAEAGRHALVIEARRRSGGRSYSRALGGSGPLEFGGSWCTDAAGRAARPRPAGAAGARSRADDPLAT